MPQGGGDPIPLLKPKLLIGRRESCDIALRFPNVSSQHCQLEFLNGYWHVRDLGSSNGIKVNGTRVDSKWLMAGDELSIAKHHYKISYTQMNDGPPPVDEDVPEMSLLEKAGLLKRKPQEPPDQHDPIPGARRGAATPNARPKPSSNDDDRAMEWLQDDPPKGR